MFVIVLHHSNLYSGALTESFSVNSLWSYLFAIGGKLGANCFFAISAYYLLDKKFSLKSVLNLHNSIWVYSILFFALNLIISFRPFTFRDIPETILPVIYNSYWFCSTYIALLFLAPFLNIIIERIEKQKHALSLAIIGGGVLIPATLLPGSVAFKDNSHIGSVLVIYFLVAYLKKYIETPNKRRCVAIFLVSSFIMWSSGVALNLIGTKLGKASIIENSTFWMTGESVFMILAGVSLFWIFLLLPERESSIINRISRGTIDVYLIHMNHFVYMWLWSECFHIIRHLADWWYPLYVIGCSTVVLGVGLLCGNLRVFVEKKFFNKQQSKLQRCVDKIDGIMNSD